MSKDLNQCNFIGRLGRDPDVRYTPGGDAVCNFSIAVGGDYTKNGQKVEETEWVRISAFGKKAEVCGEYLTKGSKIFVTGRMKTRKWQDKEGAERHTTEIMMDTMQMLDSKSQSGPSERPSGRDAQAPGVGSPPTGGSFDDFEDDIPF
jgi:single-strand DNA-binding protein